jgi:capsid assembly protease
MDSPLLISHFGVQRLSSALLAGRQVTSGELADARTAAQSAMRAVKGKVAVMPVRGMIEQRTDRYSVLYGEGFSCEFGGEAMRRLTAAKDVDAIVLDVDSPGGTSFGVQEMADIVYAARAVKPVYAVSNSMMASAAYYIGSQASQVVAAPGSVTGSIGVYLMHVDYSGALEQGGVKVQLIHAGARKVDGNPYQPLSDEARDDLQGWVDTIYEAFASTVARGRGMTPGAVKKNLGQGRVMDEDEALDCGMVDRIMTCAEVLAKLGGTPVSGYSSQFASTEVLRARHRLDVARTAKAA